jgi:hypothetical protein
MAKKSKKSSEVQVKFVTLTEVAHECNRGLSHIAKLTKKIPVQVIPAIKNGKSCSVISLADKEKLLKEVPSLKTEIMKKGERDIPSIAKERGQDVSGLRKYLIANGYKLLKRVRSEGGGPVNVLSESDYKRLCKESPTKVRL